VMEPTPDVNRPSSLSSQFRAQHAPSHLIPLVGGIRVDLGKVSPFLGDGLRGCGVAHLFSSPQRSQELRLKTTHGSEPEAWDFCDLGHRPPRTQRLQVLFRVDEP
jgi:hypothetical protein